MKKILALLSIVCAVCACSDDAKVRSAITSRVKAQLAAPGSFKFVSMERVETFTAATETKRAADLVPLIHGDWLVDENGNGYYGDPEQERIRAEIRELGAAMPQDSVVGGVYRFSYRADIPGKGRDFPAELYVVAATDGTIGGVGTSAADAIYHSPTIVEAFKIRRK